MSHQPRAAWLLATSLFLAPLTVLPGQASGTQLQLTSASEPAKRAFRAAMVESQNVAPDRARMQVATAVREDPAFGLAQVYQTLLTTGMTGEERAARIGQKLGSMGTATPAELLLALYWREVAAGRGVAAVPILQTLSSMVPNDPEIAYILDGTQRVGLSAADQVGKLRRFVARFPAHGAAYNQLGYSLWNLGDSQGALAAMEQQMKVSPDHPNAHDSYADILILLGRGAEAVPHVQREIAIDSAFGGALTKLGGIYLAMGNLPGARVQFDKAVSVATNPAARLEAMGWQVAYHVYARDARAAVQELSRMVTVAKDAKLAGAVATAHNRAAVVEAYMGDRKTVAMHLGAGEAAAVTVPQKAGSHLHAAIALSRAGKREEARAAAMRFAAAAPNNAGTNETNRLLDGVLALDGKDYKAAETAIGGMTGKDPLTKALRAELLMRTGRKAEGQTLQREVLAASVKQNSNSPMEFLWLLARMRVAAL